MTPEKWAAGLPPFPVSYDEGLKVGYKWYDAENKKPAYAFGFGLSYTSFSYSDLKATGGEAPEASFSVRNTGSRAGQEVAQLYLSLPASAGEPHGIGNRRSLRGSARECK